MSERSEPELDQEALSFNTVTNPKRRPKPQPDP